MSKEILDAALEYAQRGWAVFPVSRDKNPLTKNGCLDATTDQEQIKKWFSHYTGANVAIATGSKSKGLVVIDIDIDEDAGKYGNETLDAWMDKTGCYIDSLTAVTGRGGKHLYFYSSESFGCKVGALPNIDIRGEGGYVVAPPSKHKNGNYYEWDNMDDNIENEIVVVQEDSDVEFFLHECFKNSQAGEQKQAFVPPTDVSKGSRNDTLFKMASSLQARGLEDEIIWQTCRGYNETFTPPLPDDEFTRTLQSALKYEKGNATKTTEKKDDPQKPKVKRHLKKATDLMEKNIAPPEVIVGVGEEIPFLVEGTCILSAKAKMGKSWLALCMGLSIAAGEDFLGYKTRKSSVLYLDLETSEGIQQKRIRKALSGRTVPQNFYIDTETDKLDEGLLETLEDYLKEDNNIKLIIIDLFQIVRTDAKNNKETEYAHAYRDITPLNQFAMKHHISIILVSHDRKNIDDNDPFANILGSTGLQGAATQMIVMFKANKNTPIHISVKGKAIDGLPEMDVKLENGQWSRLDSSSLDVNREDIYKKSKIRSAAFDVVKCLGGFKGKCSEFINEAIKCGYGLTESTLEIGKFFNEYQGMFKAVDGINLEIIKNGSGSKTYKLSQSTVDTVDDTWVTVDESPME